MNRIITLLVLLTLTATSAWASKVKFTVNGIAPDKATKIMVFDAATHKPIGTVDVVDGRFTYTGTMSSDSYVVFYDNDSRTTNYIISDAESIELDMKNNRVKGSPLSVKLFELSDSVALRYEKAYGAYSIVKKAKTPEESKALKSQADALLEEADQYMEEVVKAHVKDCLPVYLIKDNFHYMSFETLKRLCESRASYTRHPMFSEVTRYYEKSKFGRSLIGKKLIDTNLRNARGEKVKLSSLVGNGKYVLVDFWASWCGPCMNEMPYLKACYEKYKDKGFEIIGISLDQDRGRWIQAISSTGLFWPQYSELKGFDCEAVLTYHVNSIPWNFLCDKEGNIIATSLRGNAVAEKLHELLDE